MSSVIQTRCARIPRLTLAVFASTLLFADTAFATAPERVRGTVVTISATELTIPTDQGEMGRKGVHDRDASGKRLSRQLHLNRA